MCANDWVKAWLSECICCSQVLYTWWYTLAWETYADDSVQSQMCKSKYSCTLSTWRTILSEKLMWCCADLPVISYATSLGNVRWHRMESHTHSTDSSRDTCMLNRYIPLFSMYPWGPMNSQEIRKPYIHNHKCKLQSCFRNSDCHTHRVGLPRLLLLMLVLSWVPFLAAYPLAMNASMDQQNLQYESGYSQKKAKHKIDLRISKITCFALWTKHGW